MKIIIISVWLISRQTKNEITVMQFTISHWR